MEDASETASPPLTGPPQAAVPRACDACRTRKIRCNREFPCAHCVHAKIDCSHSGVRPREKRTRILLSHQYEQKIDLIDCRLDGVVRLLEELKAQLPSSSSPAPSRPAESTVAASASPGSHGCHGNHTRRGDGPEAAGSVVEGESSLTAQSVFANELFRKVVGRDKRPEMHERIEALSHMVETLKKQPAAEELTYPHAKPLPPVTAEGCDLPPITTTLEVLKLAKSHTSLGAVWILDLFRLGRERFPEICLAAYMADKYDAARFITVNLGLYYLFLVYGSYFADKQDEYLRLSRVCGANVETALSGLPLHLPATDDVIVALSLGTFYALEIGKPSLAWTLTSKASELCQSLGYHRIGTYKHEPLEVTERKHFLFWVVYILDKSVSLRLGRSSTIHDHDVTIPDPSRDVPEQNPIACFFDLWVIMSRLQGQIYELLYCPAALAQSEEIRRSRVQLLANRLDELDRDTTEVSAKWDKHSRNSIGDDLTDFFLLSDHVFRLSTCTLIHRAVPNPPGSPTTFTAECIQKARETLARHQECMAIVERGMTGLFLAYMNWTILFAPFVPFIVVFCQVIETQDRTDLARLEAFVTSLQPHGSVTEAVERLRRLFQVLYNVASQYVESQTRPGRDDGQSTIEVDTCLAAMGFPSSQPAVGQQDAGFLPASTHDANDQAFQRGVNPMIWMGNGTELEDWFYNNQQMMTLLEDGFLEEPRWE